MKQTIITFLFIAITLTSFSQTQLQMNQTLSEKYSMADKELNHIYSQILVDYKNDSNFIDKLKISQRLWIKFRDAELEMKFPEHDKRNYGSIYPMCAAGYLTELTKQRTEKLKEWLEPIPKGEGCKGSLMYRDFPKEQSTIERIGDVKVQRLLNNLTILKAFKTEKLSVKILSVDNISGSAGFPNGEITNDIYLAVSEFDEYPNQNLYRISNLYNPKIDKIDTSDIDKPILYISYGEFEDREILEIEITINEIKTSR